LVRGVVDDEEVVRVLELPEGCMVAVGLGVSAAGNFDGLRAPVPSTCITRPGCAIGSLRG
jgi:hypothetical protein